MYGLKKRFFRFWLGVDLLHFFSLKNSQKLYKWGVTICRKIVRLVWKQKIFLIGYLRFEEKMYVVFWRSIKITRSKRIFTVDLKLLCHCLSKNIFEQIPAFWQKNVRCTVERAHGTVNKILQSLGYSFAEKMSVVKWEESSKLCLSFHGTREINKKFTFAYPIISRKNVRCIVREAYKT